MSDFQAGDTRPIEVIVRDDLKGKASDDEHAWLRYPETLTTWRTLLVSIKKDIETQFVSRKAEVDAFHQECMNPNSPHGKQEFFNARTDYQSWRAGAVRFKQNVESALSEAKILLRQHNRESDDKDSSWGRIAVALERIADAMEDYLEDDVAEALEVSDVPEP